MTIPSSQDTASSSAHTEEERSALSVSAAMSLAKGALEGITVRVIGEVSELSNKPGYKAVYFTIKDASASLPCMMWNNRFKAARVEMAVGSLVELTGRFTLYAAKGRMNFDVFSIALAGEGELRLRVANLAKALRAEGLMALERKRPLPGFPETIGLVTSPRGAAVHDVLRTLRRRYPLAEVLVAGVPVEGAGAPMALIEGMQRVVMGGAEVVLVVRGGGSFEDLMPFNDEMLARAIAEMPVPVVTGIGHEPDTSIADMVADVRASTPTAAAEAVAESLSDTVHRVDALGHSLRVAMERIVMQQGHRLERYALLPLFREPMRLMEADAQAIDDLSDRLRSALPRMIEADRARLAVLAARLVPVLLPCAEEHRSRVSTLRHRMLLAGKGLGTRFEAQLVRTAARLDDLSPLSILARGYAIVTEAQGAIVKSIGSVDAGDEVTVRLSDGTLLCNVQDKGGLS